MVSRSGFSGKAGKGLRSAWVTSGGLDREIGAEFARDWVSGGEDCNRCASDSSGEDCSVSAESEVPSIGSGRRVGGRYCVTRLGVVMAIKRCLLRSLLGPYSCNRVCQIVLSLPWDKHLR